MRAVPQWHPDKKFWTYRPSVDGVQKCFTSRKPGQAGAAECKRKYSQFMAKSNKSDIRFAQAWDEYVAYKKAMFGEIESVAKSEQYGKYYLLPRLKLKKVADITVKEWQDCILTARPVKKNKDALSRKTLMNIRGEITSFCKWAYDGQYLDHIPQSLKIPKTAPTIGKQILQPETLIQFLSDDSDEWYLPAWQLMVVTGLRPGECYALKKQDISDGMIRIRRSMTHDRRLTEGKNDNARRNIILTDWAGKIIKKQLEKLISNDIDCDWLFPTPDGSKPCPSTITHHWSIYRKKFPNHVTQHSLRHTFNSINQNLPEAWRKKYLGHSENMDTDGIYGHIVDGEDSLIAHALNSNLNDLFQKLSKNLVIESNEKP